MQMTWQVVSIALPNVILTIPHTKIYKDVFDERRRITRFRISPRVLTNTVYTYPQTDAEQNSA